MEYETIIQSVVVTGFAIFAILGLLSLYNTSYNEDAGSSFNTTLARVRTIENITAMGNTVGNSTQSIEGSGTSDANTDLVQRSLRVIMALPRLLGLVPDMIYDGANILGVPSIYVDGGVAVFMIGFGLLTAYLLLLGVKRLVQ